MNAPAFTVGQFVVVEPHGHHGSRFGPLRTRPVEKIGRKWATLAREFGHNDRFAIVDDEDHGRLDAANDGPYALDGGDYGSPGRVWRNGEHREAYLAKEAAWTRLTAHARERSTMPAHLATADLERIADQLTPPGE